MDSCKTRELGQALGHWYSKLERYLIVGHGPEGSAEAYCGRAEGARARWSEARLKERDILGWKDKVTDWWATAGSLLKHILALRASVLTPATRAAEDRLRAWAGRAPDLGAKLDLPDGSWVAAVKDEETDKWQLDVEKYLDRFARIHLIPSAGVARLLDVADAMARSCSAAAFHEAQGSFRNWIQESVRSGGKAAHSWIKNRHLTSIKQRIAGGKESTDPVPIMEYKRGIWTKLWCEEGSTHLDPRLPKVTDHGLKQDLEEACGELRVARRVLGNEWIRPTGEQ